MYTPEVFREEDRDEITAMIRGCGLATLVTQTQSTGSANGMMATPLPMIYAPEEGEFGVLYGHIAKANPQWKESLAEEALVIFQGVNAYITPNWYATKAETGRVVPTWNYLAVHAYGPAEWFHERERLLDVVTRLTNLHEAGRGKSWSVDDAPREFIEQLLGGIVGVRIPIVRLDAKKKISQNQPPRNRAGVKAGLGESTVEADRRVGESVPE